MSKILTAKTQRLRRELSRTDAEETPRQGVEVLCVSFVYFVYFVVSIRK